MRNFHFLVLTFTIFVIVLAACAPPSPASQPGEPAETGTVSDPTAPVEMPEQASTEPSETTEVNEVLQRDREPAYLLATWKPKIGLGPGSIYPVEPATGEALPDFEPIELGEHGFVHAFSQDGKRLAVVAFAGQSCDSYSGGTRCRGGRGELHLVDLPSWQDIKTTLPVDGYVGAIRFSTEADRLALAANSSDGNELVILDGYTGETIGQRSIDFPAEYLAFTADGSSVWVYGTPVNEPAGMAQPDPPRAVLIDTASLETRWEQELPEVISGSWCMENCEESHELVLFASYQPGVSFSQDGQRLYLVHANEDRLTTVDFGSQEVRSIAITKETSWFERLLALAAGVAQAKGGMEGAMKQAALSADGNVLYTAGHVMRAEPDEQYGWRIEQEALPVQAIELDTGRLLGSFEPDWQFTNSVRISPDGAYLVLDGWAGEQTRSSILEAESLKPISEVKSWQVHAVMGPDGVLTWLGSRMGTSLTTFAVLDPETFKHNRTWKEYGNWLAP